MKEPFRERCSEKKKRIFLPETKRKTKKVREEREIILEVLLAGDKVVGWL